MATALPRRVLPRLVTSLWLAVFGTFAHADRSGDVRFEVQREGDELVIEASATPQAPLATTWQVLVGYDQLPRFIPGMTSSRTTEREGPAATVQQSGVARWGVFRQAFSVTMRVQEEPLRSVSARAVAGDFSKMASRYELAPGDTADSTRLVYRARLQPRDGIPPLVGTHVMGDIAKTQFMALLAEIERQSREGTVLSQQTRTVPFGPEPVVRVAQLARLE